MKLGWVWKQIALQSPIINYVGLICKNTLMMDFLREAHIMKKELFCGSICLNREDLDWQ